MKKILRFIYLPLCALILACTLNMPALAADAQPDNQPDSGKTGSVSIVMKDTDSGKVVSGGSIWVCRVADAVQENADYYYEFTADFSGGGFSLDDISSEKLASDLAAYAERNRINGSLQDVKTDGTVYFGDLKTGLYLVMQQTAAKGYEEIRPFLVSVPMQTKDGAWMYDVDASPKVEMKKISGSNPTTPARPNGSGNKNSGSIGKKLPQTGQLNWPVPVLAAAGVLLFLAGWTLNHFRGKSGFER